MKALCSCCMGAAGSYLPPTIFALVLKFIKLMIVELHERFSELYRYCVVLRQQRNNGKHCVWPQTTAAQN